MCPHVSESTVAAILERDLIVVGNVRKLQSDCLVSDHPLRWGNQTQCQVFCLGRIEIGDRPNCAVVVKDAITPIVVGSNMPALTSGDFATLQVVSLDWQLVVR